MTVFTEEVDVGDVAAVSAVDVAWSLQKRGKEESLYRADGGLRKCLNSLSAHNSVTLSPCMLLLSMPPVRRGVERPWDRSKHRSELKSSTGSVRGLHRVQADPKVGLRSSWGEGYGLLAESCSDSQRSRKAI